MHETKPRNLMRARAGAARVTNVELFFDLVYVFAVTQISHYLLAHRTPTGALRAGLLLAMIWLVWVYTTWVTNWLDPDQIAVRLLLLGLAVASLIMSAALPAAFSARGLAVGVAYAVMQIGRSVFAVLALRGRPLQRNFQRILSWCLISGALAVLGGIAGGNARAALWVAAVGVDLLGGTVGFYTPGLGRSTTREWTIEGGHFAERCQAFMLIALGESIVAIGATLSGLAHIGIAEIAAFAVALCGSVGLWWLYFDRSAEDAARVIAASDDPGRLGRSAYHFIHPVMVAGIIVSAAADEVALADPGAVGRAGNLLDDPRRRRALPGRARGVQGRRVANAVLAADRGRGRPGSARAGRAAHLRACPGRLRRSGHRRGRRHRLCPALWRRCRNG